MIPSIECFLQSLKALHRWMLAVVMRNQEYLRFFKRNNHKALLKWGYLPIGSTKYRPAGVSNAS